MTLEELCDAAITMSDNTAGNLLLASFGGPAALTAYLRWIGDAVTRLDRIEPDLNETAPGDPRDTTSPAAMLANLQRVALGDGLSSASRDRLVEWLVANKTGDARLRAGLPKDWRVGDKTGSWQPGNDKRHRHRLAAPLLPPLLVAAYYTESSASPDERNAVLADVARHLAEGVHVEALSGALRRPRSVS